jgi:tetratricopeptide (TPR) repeat protein
MLNMRTIAALLALLLVAPILVAQTSSQLSARDELDQGVRDYRNARYEEAAEHFRNAVALDPNSLYAHLYLGTVYAQMFIPGAETPENQAWADKAITEFKNVLNLDPRNINSIKGIASLYFNSNKLDEAKDYYQRGSEIEPEDPENYYCMAVIDWSQSYKTRMDQRSKLKLNFEKLLIKNAACSVVRDRNLERVQHGMEMLEKALKLRPADADAMAYMNLLYRERADIQCGNQSAYDEDVNSADEWVEKTIAVKKAEEESGKSEGIIYSPGSDGRKYGRAGEGNESPEQ